MTVFQGTQCMLVICVRDTWYATVSWLCGAAGTVPDLSNLSQLLLADLSHNALNGKHP